jgi:hypothetical protein
MKGPKLYGNSGFLPRTALGLAVIFAMAGCNKNSNPVYSFQFQMGGTVYSFDSVSALVDTPSAYITSIYAENSKTKSYVTITMQSNIKSLTGVYSHIFPQPTNDILIGFTILIISGPSAISYGVEGEPFTLTVDQAGNHMLTGRFSGAIGMLVGSQNDTVQNGQFHIPFSYR